jgi:hypothetical protein
MIILSVAMPAVASKEITIVRLFAPGGPSEQWSIPLKSALAKKGYTVDYKGFTGCRDAVSWIKNNPKKTMIWHYYLDQYVSVMGGDQFKNLDSFCDLPAGRENLITLTTMHYYQVCLSPTDKNQTFDNLVTNRNIKIGFFNHPINSIAVQGLLKDLNLGHAKTVGFPGGKFTLQAHISGDINAAVWSNNKAITAIGGKCIITTSSKDSGMLSLKKINSTSRWIDTGQIAYYGGQNFDRTKLTSDLLSIFIDDKVFVKLFEEYTPVGIVAGESESSQWERVLKYVKNFK